MTNLCLALCLLLLRNQRDDARPSPQRTRDWSKLKPESAKLDFMELLKQHSLVLRECRKSKTKIQISSCCQCLRAQAISPPCLEALRHDICCRVGWADSCGQVYAPTEPKAIQKMKGMPDIQPKPNSLKLQSKAFDLSSSILHPIDLLKLKKTQHDPGPATS